MSMRLRVLCWFLAVVASSILGAAQTSRLRNVRLRLIPEEVERGQTVRLVCEYDLQEGALYSLKWYRGQHEFYRYSPTESPPTKIFSFSWISVDALKSNESQVTIRQVQLGLSGEFSCEVTSDAPDFSTASSRKLLRVLALPRAEPRIAAERTRYRPGDILRANCSAPMSRPAARLSFALNRLPLPASQRDQQHSTQLQVSLRLQPSHYVDGRLSLRCSATVAGLYEQTSELRLDEAVAGPVSSSSSSSSSFNAAQHCRPSAHFVFAAALQLALTHFGILPQLLPTGG